MYTVDKSIPAEDLGVNVNNNELRKRSSIKKKDIRQQWSRRWRGNVWLNWWYLLRIDWMRVLNHIFSTALIVNSKQAVVCISDTNLNVREFGTDPRLWIIVTYKGIRKANTGNNQKGKMK